MTMICDFCEKKLPAEELHWFEGGNYIADICTDCSDKIIAFTETLKPTL